MRFIITFVFILCAHRWLGYYKKERFLVYRWNSVVKRLGFVFVFSIAVRFIHCNETNETSTNTRIAIICFRGAWRYGQATIFVFENFIIYYYTRVDRKASLNVTLITTTSNDLKQFIQSTTSRFRRIGQLSV